MPFLVGIVVVEQVGQLLGGDVEHAAGVLPRLEAQVASLVVERIPRDVDWTLGDGLLEQRPPEARAVAVDADEVGLWRPVSD